MRKLLGLLVLLGACGDDPVKRLPDGPPQIDALPPPIDTPTGPVTLTITSGTMPVMGIKVYFQNSDSSLVSATETDASGVASATMDPGGYVTAVNPFTRVLPSFGGFAREQIRTFAGVKPGDQLQLKDTS